MAEFYASERTISERAALLLEHARELLTSGVIPDNKVILRENRIRLIAEGYFLFNEFYKNWRISDGHFTERPKIAAIQSIVINRLQPFIPISASGHLINTEEIEVSNTNLEEVLYVIKCNEIFACSYSLGILEKKLFPDTPAKRDFWLRLLDVITTSSCQTLEPYITDKEYQIERNLTEYRSSELKPHQADRPALNSLICIFELLSKKGEDIRT